MTGSKHRLVGLLLTLVVVGLLGGSFGCASSTIRGEDIYGEGQAFRIDEEAEIEDTVRNREVLNVLAQYRQALVQKDFGEIQQLISEQYYDNAGTTDTTEDDYGTERLPDVFETLANHANEIKYNVLVKNLEYEGDSRAFLDYEYQYAYKYKIDDKPTWDAGVELNRLELVKEEGTWRIAGGL